MTTLKTNLSKANLRKTNLRKTNLKTGQARTTSHCHSERQSREEPAVSLQAAKASSPPRPGKGTTSVVPQELPHSEPQKHFVIPSKARNLLFPAGGKGCKSATTGKGTTSVVPQESI